MILAFTVAVYHEAAGRPGRAPLESRVHDGSQLLVPLELIDAHPRIAMLFTDIVMPEVNGRQLFDEAPRRRPALKVLFTTGYTRNAIVHDGQLDPGVHLVCKPYTIEDLAAGVRAVLDEGT